MMLMVPEETLEVTIRSRLSLTATNVRSVLALCREPNQRLCVAGSLTADDLVRLRGEVQLAACERQSVRGA